jgi:hypothetical protein
MSEPGLHRGRKFKLLIGIIIVILLVLSACDILSLLPRGMDAGNGEPGQEEGDSDEIPEPGDQNPPVAISCPSEPTQFTLFVSHTFDYSPGRNTQMMLISGSSGLSSPCSLTVDRERVTAQDCFIPYTNAGTVNTDAGPCQHDGQGQAILSIEGSCSDGELTLTLTEMPDASAGLGGTLNCPQVSEPYVTFYPPSITTRTFVIQVGGYEATEDANPDISNSFTYHKSWTLYSQDLLSPPSLDE